MSERKVTSNWIESDSDYAGLESLLAARIAGVQEPLFTTNATGLFDTYLAGIKESFRRHYDCRACQRFLDKYGGLVTIVGTEGKAEVGLHKPLLWLNRDGDREPAFFAQAIDALWDRVRNAKVTGVFLSSDKVWGQPQTGEWTHLSGTPPTVFSSPVKTASQAMAEKLQDYITLKKGLEDYSLAAAQQAVRVLAVDALDRSEKAMGIAGWFLHLHTAIADKRGTLRDNLIWRAVALAPPGFCHVRSTMISTLLDDIVAGLDYEVIRARWAQKMHPLQYQRPTAPPTAGAIIQANQIVEQLASAGALARRFARLEDLTTLWTPTVEPLAAPVQSAGGVFDHLRQDKPVIQEVRLPAQSISWEKFRDKVLYAPRSETARALDCQVPSGPMPFYGFVTAVNPDAPPLLQWDGLADQSRNPVSWYYYHGGSLPKRWNLEPGNWVAVQAVCLAPPHWQRPERFTQHTQAVHFVLDGARDLDYKTGALFFPESLKSEYHPIRSVMEAYALQAVLQGRDEGNANGIAFQKGHATPLTLRVKTAQGTTLYRLDRWE